MFIKNNTPPEFKYEAATREHIFVNIYDSNKAGGMSGTVIFYRDRSLDGSFLQIGWKASNGFKCWTGTIIPDVGTYVGNEPLVSNSGKFGTVSAYSGFIPELSNTKPVAANDRGLLSVTKLSTPTEYRARVPNTDALRLLPSMDHDIKDGKGRGESDGFDYKSALFALSASKGTTDLVLGREATIYGSGEVLVDGEFCFDHVRGLDYVISGSEGLGALDDFTIEMDYTITSNATGYCGFYGNKTSWSDMCICAQWGRSGRRPAMFWNNYFDTTTGGPTHDDWVNDGVYHHLAWVRSGSTIKLYSDGIAICQYTGATLKLNIAIQNRFSVGVQHVENQCLPGRMKHFKINNTALYTEDFSDNLPKWVGM